MIKVICFDLDGVYFPPEGKKAFQKALTDMTKNDEKVQYVLYKCPEMLEFVKGKMEEHLFWDFVRNYLDLKLTDQEFRDLWTKEYTINEEVRKYVLNAKAQGYKTCICSNNNIARIESLQARFNFLDDFDIKIFSYEIGFVKPEKEFFEELIKQSEVNANEIVYSDDRPDRIEGAKELGINVFVYENFPQFLSELKKLGVDLG